MKTIDSDLRTRRLIWLFLIAATLLLIIIPSSRPIASAVTPQGKGGEVVAKPTPTPKKTPAPRRRSNKKSGNASPHEIAFWNSIKDSTDPEDFKAYLKKYANGEFAALANNRLKNLEAAKAKPTPSPNSGLEATKTQPQPTCSAKSPSQSTGRTRTVSLRGGVQLGLVEIPPGSFCAARRVAVGLKTIATSRRAFGL